MTYNSHENRSNCIHNFGRFWIIPRTFQAILETFLFLYGNIAIFIFSTLFALQISGLRSTLTYKCRPQTAGHNNIILVGDDSKEDKEKKTSCFSWAPLQGTQSFPIVWFFSSMKTFNHPTRWRLEPYSCMASSRTLRTKLIWTRTLMPNFSLKQLIQFLKTWKKWNEKQYNSGLRDGELLTAPDGTTSDFKFRSFILNHFGDVEVVSVCPIKNNHRNSGTCTMGKDKDTIIIEFRLCKCKKTLIVWFMELVRSKNIAEDIGHK